MSNNQLATRDENKITALVDNPQYRSRINDLLGERAPQFVSSIISIGKNMADVDAHSVIAAAITAATLNLPINQNLGFAYIVAYRDGQGPKVAQFQMGYKGFIQLAIRTGQYRFLNAFPVTEGEFENYSKLTGELRLRKDPDPAKDKIVGYASYFQLLNGFEHAFYWTVEQCEAHGKKYSQTYRKGYGKWKDDFDAMALKTVIKLNLSKWGILSVQMEKALFEDQAVRRDLHAEAFYPDGNEAISGPTGLPAITQTEGGEPSGEKNVTPRGAAKKAAKKTAGPTEPPGPVGDSPPITVAAELKAKIAESGYTEAEVLTVALGNGWAAPGTVSLEDIEESRLKPLLTYWDEVTAEIDQVRSKAVAE